MVEVNEALTRKVADLARLELTDAEVKTYTAQLDDVLKFVDQLHEVNVDGVEPLSHPLDLQTPLREDVVKLSPQDADGNPKVLSCAPEVVDGGFQVPPIL